MFRYDAPATPENYPLSLHDALPISRSAGEGITGTTQSGLGFFEQRVADHPDDVAARLDLAQRYLETGKARSAIEDRKSTRLNSSHLGISYAVFCLKKKRKRY